MSLVPKLDAEACRKLGLYPVADRQHAIGQDFCYDWNKVRTAAQLLCHNLDRFLSLPIASRLAQKGLKTPVTFWFTPLNQILIVTVCSTRKADFMNPLHRMAGYMEYGASYLRPTARPFLHYDGARVIRVHVLDSPSEAEHFVADFANLFGLTVAESDEDQYNDIRSHPADHFEYSAVSHEAHENVSWKGQDFLLHHALCVLN